MILKTRKIIFEIGLLPNWKDLILVFFILFSCGQGTSSSGDSEKNTDESTNGATDINLFDCQAISNTSPCISGYISTQGMKVDGVDITDNRREYIEPKNFVDSADFADRMPQELIIPIIKMSFEAAGQSFDASKWEISLEPQVTRSNFGQGFTVDLQGPVSVQADIKNTGKFQITKLRLGAYQLRLYKEFTLTALKKSSKEKNYQCIVLESLISIDLSKDAPHKELGAIGDFSFYYRPGDKACDGATDSGTGSDGSSSSISNTSSSVSTNTDTSSANESNEPLLTFSNPVKTFCQDHPLIAIVPNLLSTVNPWLITKDGRKIVAQKINKESASLEVTGSTIDVNIGNGACIDTQYTPTFTFAAPNSSGSLFVTWNCTGDGSDRFWQKGISYDGSIVFDNNYLGSSLAYNFCTFSHGAATFKCKSKFLKADFSFDSDTGLLAATDQTSEIGTTDGFALVSGSTLQIYKYQTQALCSISSLGAGMGLVESKDGTFIYTYNGKTLEKIAKKDCSRTTLGSIRTGTDGFFLEAPILNLQDERILVAGKLSNSLHFEEILLSGSAAKLGRLLSVPLPKLQGTFGILLNSSGFKFFTKVRNESDCDEIRLSETIQ